MLQLDRKLFWSFWSLRFRSLMKTCSSFWIVWVLQSCERIGGLSSKGAESWVSSSQFNSSHQLQFAPLVVCHCTVQETLQAQSSSDKRGSPAAVNSLLHSRTRIRLILICKYPLCWRYNTLPPLNEKSPGAASVPWRRKKHWKIQITLAIPPSLPLLLFSICPTPSLHMPQSPPCWGLALTTTPPSPPLLPPLPLRYLHIFLSTPVCPYFCLHLVLFILFITPAELLQCCY